MTAMYKLPEKLRGELRIPLGKIVDERELEKIKINPPIISVGDMVTLTLDSHGIIPNLCIVDFAVERNKCDEWMVKKIKEIGEEVFVVKNPPGTISRELWDCIQKAFAIERKVRIEVDGEEDLAALPAIYLSPRNATVIYGLPLMGMVAVEVNDDKKEKVRKFLNKMRKWK
jgi:hypothetical protein